MASSSGPPSAFRSVGSLIGTEFAVLTLVTAALGLSVIGMSAATGPAGLACWLLLVRGFGQTPVGGQHGRDRQMVPPPRRHGDGRVCRVADVRLHCQRVGRGRRRSAVGMGVGLARARVGIAGAVPLFWLLARNTPESCGLAPDERSEGDQTAAAGSDSYTLRQALATPAFWVIVLGGSAFNLVWSGVTLFNESILAERGLDQALAVQTWRS